MPASSMAAPRPGMAGGAINAISTAPTMIGYADSW
jgi:hypothetical protein